MDGQLLELLLVVHMTMKPVQVVQMKRKNQLLNLYRGPVYSHFERMVLNQLHELNVSQHEHHNYCNQRFNALDGQIHDIHDMLHSFQTRNDPQDD